MLDKKHYILQQNFNLINNILIDVVKNDNIIYDSVYISLAAWLVSQGFDITLIHFPYIKKTKERDENTLNYFLEGYIEFTTANKPLEKYVNEFNIKKKVLKKYTYDDFFSLQWATEEGEKIRDEIHRELSKQNLQKEYLNWKKKHKKLKKKLQGIITNFKKQNPKNRLSFEYDDERNVFLIRNKRMKKNRARFKMKIDEKEKVARKYNQDYLELFQFLEKTLKHSKLIGYRQKT